MKASLILGSAVLGFATLATQAAFADTDTSAIPSYSAPSTLTRAEVQADLALWRRAGLEELAALDSFDPTNPNTAARIAQYQQWRAGSEYRTELARLQNRSMTAQARAGQSTTN
jgi:hypothetical protein